MAGPQQNTHKPWLKQRWGLTDVSGAVVAARADGLDLDAAPYAPKRPTVCVDETNRQVLADTQPPLPGHPGRPRRVEYEYTRDGTRNLFMHCAPPIRETRGMEGAETPILGGTQQGSY
jgi:hypothetical protein